ncbi:MULTISPECIES: TetR/AcrR family transcriptional regulator [Actinomadura]|uniref:TetR family transcriptional regulator n=1 Tax=Actinomadura litoris TaxID=2678616 RepID=A0A7K1L4Y9_9ACTN|nr:MULTISPECIES: TetR/AcrR family transcriptional regulator [Actinomadura]MBT2212481.1 TetR/AcrR family transcriptional regulator [Actinomadura sp. NEAU-AAG7]MUN39459.1 TetR family transcriptional regulator [Actinomadura litoris]
MKPQETADPAARPLRADVRRNRENLLAAAREIFTSHGAESSLESVAERAGVGIGTLYRHFPTRQDLLESLLADGYDQLGLRAHELLDDPDPGAAFVTWLEAFIAQVTPFRGMAASVVVTMRDERSELFHSCHAMRTAGATLFARALEAGAVPPGTAFLDVLRLAGGIAMATEGEPEMSRRLLDLAVHGVVPGAATGPSL